jgi:hypothetical protein
MEINRAITSVWTVVIKEEEVLNRFIDETIHEAEKRSAGKEFFPVASDDDRSNLHRYYCGALAELSSLLARRTRRVGGGIGNETDDTTKMITTTYFMPMSANHEDSLLEGLGAHCLDFLVARLMEKWVGHGSNFGAEDEKNMIREIIHFRRFPIERPFRIL